MHYYIYCNQKKMNPNHLSAIEEFQKRLSAYCETTFYFDSTLEFPREANSHNHQFIFIRSGKSTYTSEEFAQFINQLMNSGKSNIHIVIGFSETLFYTALEAVNDYSTPHYMSLTNSNLSSETKSILLFEQLYRGYTILQGKNYHK